MFSNTANCCRDTARSPPKLHLGAMAAQHHINVAARLKSFAVSYDDTGKLPEFDEFFKKLIDHIESQVLTVVESMEYSKIQGEVAEHGTKIKEAMNGLSEILFEDVPFVTKNNIDDLASEIASLRAKVRNLEAGVRKTVKKSDKVVA